jgi:hypothetical protein
VRRECPCVSELEASGLDVLFECAEGIGPQRGDVGGPRRVQSLNTIYRVLVVRLSHSRRRGDGGMYKYQWLMGPMLVHREPLVRHVHIGV